MGAPICASGQHFTQAECEIIGQEQGSGWGYSARRDDSSNTYPSGCYWFSNGKTYYNSNLDSKKPTNGIRRTICRS